ncbi:MAG: tRNA threonylcarbamoyladenosine dehydratase [Clostridia bacterium]|nr:tRNA threonylcarbamoyladenosine dehydratase [Clostridia bacterium]
MIDERFSRTAMLLGEEAAERLAHAHVAVFGLGGVGGHLVEALARSGIGKLTIFDHDTVSVSNINRQAAALTSTVGQYKADVLKTRCLDINPNMEVTAHKVFYLPENADDYDFSEFDYVADAVDTVTAKLLIIEKAKEKNIPVISCMGAGNKLDPTAFCVADIEKTSVCPLARVMRRELKKRGIENVKVVYSTEPAISPEGGEKDEFRRQTPGSCAFVPSVAGLIMAGEIIKDLALVR